MSNFFKSETKQLDETYKKDLIKYCKKIKNKENLYYALGSRVDGNAFKFIHIGGKPYVKTSSKVVTMGMGACKLYSGKTMEDFLRDVDVDKGNAKHLIILKNSKVKDNLLQSLNKKQPKVLVLKEEQFLFVDLESVNNDDISFNNQDLENQEDISFEDFGEAFIKYQEAAVSLSSSSELGRDIISSLEGQSQGNIERVQNILEKSCLSAQREYENRARQSLINFDSSSSQYKEIEKSLDELKRTEPRRANFFNGLLEEVNSELIESLDKNELKSKIAEFRKILSIKGANGKLELEEEEKGKVLKYPNFFNSINKIDSELNKCQNVNELEKAIEGSLIDCSNSDIEEIKKAGTQYTKNVKGFVEEKQKIIKDKSLQNEIRKSAKKELEILKKGHEQRTLFFKTVKKNKDANFLSSENRVKSKKIDTLLHKFMKGDISFD